MAKKLSKKSLTKSVRDTYISGRREHFRGVIWPRDPMNGPQVKVYRYPIVGMIVSDQPIEMFESKNEIVLDGNVHGICDILEVAPRGKAFYPLGTAESVLCSLEHCIGKKN